MTAWGTLGKWVARLPRLGDRSGRGASAVKALIFYGRAAASGELPARGTLTFRRCHSK
jgi:hypothetical protein